MVLLSFLEEVVDSMRAELAQARWGILFFLCFWRLVLVILFAQP